MVSSTSTIGIQYLSLCTVAIFWGVTNPFLARHSKQETISTPPISTIETTKRSDRNVFLIPLLTLAQLAKETVLFFANWKFALAFAINQLGSVLYFSSLTYTGKLDEVVFYFENSFLFYLHAY
jgi:hypothetical protein